MKTKGQIQGFPEELNQRQLNDQTKKQIFDLKFIRKRFARPGSLPHFFRIMRISRDLTIDQFAEKIQFSTRALKDFEAGTRFPSLRYCLACGKEFGANENWIRRKLANESINQFEVSLRKRLQI